MPRKPSETWLHIEAGEFDSMKDTIQALAAALTEGLRLYDPQSAGLWAEQARAALKQAEPWTREQP